MVNYWS